MLNKIEGGEGKGKIDCQMLTLKVKKAKAKLIAKC
jgi:hypothetical protein